MNSERFFIVLLSFLWAVNSWVDYNRQLQVSDLQRQNIILLGLIADKTGDRE